MALFYLIIFSLVLVALHTNVLAGSCSEDWTTNTIQFESSIQYEDMRSKADPTVTVFINGKAAKMMLDTGAQGNVLWDASLLNETPSSEAKRLYAHVASAEGRTVRASLTDEKGNTSRQEFYLISGSVLRDHGYAGILSPQTVAADNALLIDLERDCFFTSPSFDIRPNNSLDVSRSFTIANPYGIMAIFAELDGRKIPLLVDTGAAVTSISAALLMSKPKGQRSPGGIDMFGAKIPQGEYLRLVDLKINGEDFRSLPVIPRVKVSEIEGIVDGDKEGLETYGFIGMDVLKNRVIYYDGKLSEFFFVNRIGARQRQDWRTWSPD